MDGNFSWTLFFKIAKIEIIYSILGFIFLLFAKHKLSKRVCTLLESFLFFSILYFLYFGRSTDQLIITNWFYLTPLQSICKAWLYLLAFSSYRSILVFQSAREHGLFFLFLAFFSLSFSFINSQALPAILFFLLLFPAKFTSPGKKKKNFRRLIIFILAVILLPLCFYQPSSEAGPLLQFIPLIIVYIILGFFVTLFPRAQFKKQGNIFLVFQALLTMFFVVSCWSFSVAHYNSPVLYDLSHFFRFALLWLLMVQLFQNTVLPKPDFHFFCFYIPLGLILLLNFKIRGLESFLVLAHCLIPFTILFFYLQENYKKYYLVELLIMPLNLLCLAAFFFVKFKPIYYSHLIDLFVLTSICFISALIGLYKHRREIKKEHKQLLSPMLLFWAFSFLAHNQVNTIAQKLFEHMHQLF